MKQNTNIVAKQLIQTNMICTHMYVLLYVHTYVYACILVKSSASLAGWLNWDEQQPGSTCLAIN